MEKINTRDASSLLTTLSSLRQYLEQRILGQRDLVLRLLIALLADGHLLVEGAPGLAKTTAIKELADSIHASFHRLQFTPDLLPADLTGTEIYRPEEGSFNFQPGPLFHNLILADEINRAPAKVQSALLEAMGERQITIGRKTYTLPDLFLVMATQNPIEQEGTYPLPEAQLDRFLMHIRIDYPDAGAEQAILHLNRAISQHGAGVLSKRRIQISADDIFQARKQLYRLHMSPQLENYLVELVLTTRNPTRYDNELERLVRFGASPRATIALDKCARAHAWLQGRDYVSPEDIQAIAHDVLRHRILLTYEAQAEGISADAFITALLDKVPVP